MKKIFLIFLLLLIHFSVNAQKQSSSVAPQVSMNTTADTIADAAIKDWLAKKIPAKTETDTSTLDGQMKFIERSLLFTPAPKNGRVNFGLRKLLGANNQRRIYQYPLAADDGDSSVNLTLQKKNGVWNVRGIRQMVNAQLIPDFVFEPMGGIVFIALTALLLYGVFAKTAWRSWMIDAFALARQNFATYLISNLLLYGLFILGAGIGYAAPQLVSLLQEYTASALSQGGLSKLAQASVPSAAFGIVTNNVRAGLLLTSFLPGAIFPPLAYIINISLALFYGLALSPAVVPGATFLLHVPTILLEFQAYWFVVAASGVMMLRILGRARVPIAVAFPDYAKSLAVGLTFLVLAAWYEAFEVLVLIPLLGH